MKYNLIETENVKDSILELNGIDEKELNKEYDFIIKDEVFLNFKDKLLENRNKKFLIVGDYDCDGICSTTIIKKLLIELNIESNYYIPSRLKDGYGLNTRIIDMAKENNFDCLILVDNGIALNDYIDYANSLNLIVYIIDHHEYNVLPNAYAIIHSNIVSNTYKDLSAGGLSFILSRCFYEDDLSLVLGGLSTVSDMMPVLDFNRYLIKKMMDLIKDDKNSRLYMLNDYKKISYDDLSFTIIPKINAISRMEPIGNPNYLPKFFLSSEDDAKKNLETINYINEQRKIATKRMIEDVHLETNINRINVIYSKDFKEGLCGLIANRLLHTYNMPIVVLALSEGYYKGSGRSTDSFNLHEALSKYDKYDTYGGHEGAVGLAIKEEDLTDFLEFVNNIEVDTNDVKDALLVDIEAIDFNLLNILEDLKPFGTGLKEPLFAILNEGYRKIVVANKYPKYLIRKDLSAICFNSEYLDRKAKYLIGNIKKDNYHPNSLSISIEDLIE